MCLFSLLLSSLLVVALVSISISITNKKNNNNNNNDNDANVNNPNTDKKILARSPCTCARSCCAEK